jgi:tetratricopeptide (TPR) repeat protein
MSGGNPLLALTLLDSDDWDSLPDDPSLVDQLLRRLEAVSEPARAALQAAAVIGFQFDYGPWETLASSAVDIPTADLPALAGELERARLILLESEGYRFAHDTLRACVYTHIPPRQRQQLHQQALATFRQYRPADTLDLLHHAEQAGDREAIAHYALPAGQQALRHFTYQAAVDYFSKALQALPADDWAGRYAAVLGRVQALDVLAGRDRQQAALDLLQQLAEKLDDDGCRAEVAYYRANFYWATGAYTQARATAEAGLGQARRIDDLKQQALLLEIMGRSARDLGRYAQANEWFMEARACYTQLGDERGAAWIDGMIGIVAQRQGRLQEAIAYHTRAMNAHRQIGDPFNEMRAASGLAIALWMAGDYGQSRSIFEHTLHLSREVEDHRMEEASLANLGGLADVLADYTTAIELKEQALALSRASENKMGVALGLCNLGITYYKLGHLGQSLAAFDEAVTIDRETGRRQGEAYSLHGRGMTLFEMGRVAEARRSLQKSRAIRTELAERDVLIATEADLALVVLAEEEPEQTLVHLKAALESLQVEDRADLREQVYYAAYRVTAAHGNRAVATEHLRRAKAAMMELADALPPEARQRFLQQDPLNRKVQAALDALMRKAQVRLVRADVPLGRKLTEADYTQVTWTLYAPEDDAFTGAAKRRHVLKRLLAEAEAQGAVPTDDDLAQALDVSRRTIVRDMKTLAQAGHPLPTRRRATN